jgi:IS30 family transposase
LIATNRIVGRVTASQIAAVGLAPLDVWFDVDRWHQFHLVAQCLELAGPEVARAARLDTDQTGFQLANKETQTAVSALIRQARKLPTELYKSLTWDRGKELADHRRFSLATDIDVYFCDPQSPWQRGSNENTNGLLRQYFPKGTDLSVYSQADLNKVARQLNERPRKTLEFETPAERFNACVASTG